MASTTVTFQVHAELNKGEFVHLLGDIPQLGSFSLDQAVKMHVDRSEWPWWKITVQLPKGCSIKYKYAVYSGGSFSEWEPLPRGDDRTLVVSTDHHMTVKDKFGEPSSHGESKDEESSGPKFDHLDISPEKLRQMMGKGKLIVVSWQLPVTAIKEGEYWDVSWDEDSFLARNRHHSIADTVKTVWVGSMSSRCMARHRRSSEPSRRGSFDSFDHLVDDRHIGGHGEFAPSPRPGFRDTRGGTYISRRTMIDPSDYERGMIDQELARMDCSAVWLDQGLGDRFSKNYCDAVLWPALHNVLIPGLVSSDAEERSWDAYKEVNKEIARAVLKTWEKGDVIWVHDYHLALVPYYLAQFSKERPPIVFFMHAPFPTSEIFRTLAHREEILEGILSADVVGFHTFNHARHFLHSSKRITGLKFQSRKYGRIGVQTTSGRDVIIAVSHVGVDMKTIQQWMRSQGAAETAQQIRSRHQGKKIIVGIDPCERLSGIALKLLAFEHLLEQAPAFRTQVVLVQRCEFKRHRKQDSAITSGEVHDLVNRINTRFKTQVIDYEEAVAYPPTYKVGLFHCADLLLQTPIREGLNLLPLEYIYARMQWQLQKLRSQSLGGHGSLSSFPAFLDPDNQSLPGEGSRQGTPLDPKLNTEENPLDASAELTERVLGAITPFDDMPQSADESDMFSCGEDEEEGEEKEGQEYAGNEEEGFGIGDNEDDKSIAASYGERSADEGVNEREVRRERRPANQDGPEMSTRLFIPHMNISDLGTPLPPPPTCGSVILSEFSTASHILNSNHKVCPWDVKEVATVINKALVEKEDTTLIRQTRDYAYITRNPVSAWTREVLVDCLTLRQEGGGVYMDLEPSLAKAQSKIVTVAGQGFNGQLSSLNVNTFIEDFKKARRRVLFFDAFGTLIAREGSGLYIKDYAMNGSVTSMMPSPIVKALSEISKDPDTLIFVVCGISVDTFDNLFSGELDDVSLVAENGLAYSLGASAEAALAEHLDKSPDSHFGSQLALGPGVQSFPKLMFPTAFGDDEDDAAAAAKAKGAPTYSFQRKWRRNLAYNTPRMAEWEAERVKARNIMEEYTWTVNGSIVREWETFITWDHRASDPEWSQSQALVLKNKLMEVLRTDVVKVSCWQNAVAVTMDLTSKGRVVDDVLHALGGADFVMAIGDDIADEDMFHTLNRLLSELKEAKEELDTESKGDVDGAKSSVAGGGEAAGSSSAAGATATSNAKNPSASTGAASSATASTTQTPTASTPSQPGGSHQQQPTMIADPNLPIETQSLLMTPPDGSPPYPVVAFTQNSSRGMVLLGTSPVQGPLPPPQVLPPLVSLPGAMSTSTHSSLPTSTMWNAPTTGGLPVLLGSGAQEAGSEEAGKPLRLQAAVQLDDVYTITVGRKRSHAMSFTQSVDTVHDLVIKMLVALRPESATAEEEAKTSAPVGFTPVGGTPRGLLSPTLKPQSPTVVAPSAIFPTQPLPISAASAAAAAGTSNAPASLPPSSIPVHRAVILPMQPSMQAPVSVFPGSASFHASAQLTQAGSQPTGAAPPLHVPLSASMGGVASASFHMPGPQAPLAAQHMTAPSMPQHFSHALAQPMAIAPQPMVLPRSGADAIPPMPTASMPAEEAIVPPSPQSVPAGSASAPQDAMPAATPAKTPAAPVAAQPIAGFVPPSASASTSPSAAPPAASVVQGFPAGVAGQLWPSHSSPSVITGAGASSTQAYYSTVSQATSGLGHPSLYGSMAIAPQPHLVHAPSFPGALSLHHHPTAGFAHQGLHGFHFSAESLQAAQAMPASALDGSKPSPPSPTDGGGDSGEKKESAGTQLAGHATGPQFNVVPPQASLGTAAPLPVLGHQGLTYVSGMQPLQQSASGMMYTFPQASAAAAPGATAAQVYMAPGTGTPALMPGAPLGFHPAAAAAAPSAVAAPAVPPPGAVAAGGVAAGPSAAAAAAPAAVAVPPGSFRSQRCRLQAQFYKVTLMNLEPVVAFNNPRIG